MSVPHCISMLDHVLSNHLSFQSSHKRYPNDSRRKRSRNSSEYPLSLPKLSHVRCVHPEIRRCPRKRKKDSSDDREDYDCVAAVLVTDLQHLILAAVQANQSRIQAVPAVYEHPAAMHAV